MVYEVKKSCMVKLFDVIHVCREPTRSEPAWPAKVSDAHADRGGLSEEVCMVCGLTHGHVMKPTGTMTTNVLTEHLL